MKRAMNSSGAYFVVVAALGLFLPTFRFKGSHRKSVLTGLKRTARQISRRLSQSVERKAT